MTWLPADFSHPLRVDLPAGDHHMRPIHPDDTDLDMIAVMGSQERLWSIFGEPWGWPPKDMTHEDDRRDLARHADEMEAHESFNFAIFDEAESELLGCVYIDPPEKVGADADVSWWVVDDMVGSPLELTLEHFVPRWVREAWPFTTPRYIGLDVSWSAWMALPDA
ncbi:MAG: GNAT family N-acetyltransferase [Acidimicrobiales bacterium]